MTTTLPALPNHNEKHMPVTPGHVLYIQCNTMFKWKFQLDLDIFQKRMFFILSRAPMERDISMYVFRPHSRKIFDSANNLKIQRKRERDRDIKLEINKTKHSIWQSLCFQGESYDSNFTTIF